MDFGGDDCVGIRVVNVYGLDVLVEKVLEFCMLVFEFCSVYVG